MTSYENFYGGADYGLEGPTTPYANVSGYGSKASDFGIPTDPRTANQLDATSKKVSTGAKTIEVSGITPQIFESMPEHHLKEVNRLKKLTGVDLTFHGPLIEPTGITRSGWEDTQRQHVERQMFSAVERAQKMDPDGNIIVTFHSSHGLPNTEVRTINEKTGEEEITQIFLVDKSTGRFAPIGPPQKDYFGGKPVDLYEQVKKQNKESWFNQLQNISFHAHNGEVSVKQALSPISDKLSDEKNKKILLDFYKTYTEKPEKAKEMLKQLGPEYSWVADVPKNLSNGDIYLRDAYQKLQGLFNAAYDNALQNNNEDAKNKLDKFQQSIAPKLSYIENPEKIEEFAETITEGVNVLRTINPPETLTPLKDFAIDKASDTFSNLAFNAYKKFKDKSPIISIENPPAGSEGSGLSRADEMRALIESSQKKFIEKAQDKLGLSESEAKKQAEKLIGVTWDVGHINMIRKFGYDEKQLLKETEKIAPFIKHVHLSDNFGMDHTELPMGMGNVPTKQHLEILEKYNKQLKKIAETGSWFSAGLGQFTPLRETFEAFGAPIYAGGASWSEVSSASGGYFAGIGPTNPDYHHSLYGAGFSNLPVELGGQMRGRSRVGGAPME